MEENTIEITKRLLEKYYLDNQMTLKEISRITGCSYNKILKLMNEFGIRSKSICTKCEFINHNKSYFCIRCGQDLMRGGIRLTESSPEIILEWDYNKNSAEGIYPDYYTKDSSKIVWWICQLGHSYQCAIRRKRVSKLCHYCDGKKTLKDFNNLAITFPEIAKEWNYKLNDGITPYDVPPFSMKKFAWTGQCGHTWTSSVAHRTKDKSGCPICAGKIVLVGFNDLMSIRPDLAKEYSDKNTKRANEITASSGIKRLWRCCKCGHEWWATPHARNKPNFKGTSCPKCKSSKLEKETAKILDKNNVEYIREYKFNDCISKYKLRFDFYLPKYNIIIECQGIQHYKNKCLEKFGNSSFVKDKSLDDIFLRDKIKIEYLNKNEIGYLYIPYWAINDIEVVLEKFIFQPLGIGYDI